ncbi:MAG: hypothetical protein V4484_00625 [Pseudomonadota bacterium]
MKMISKIAISLPLAAAIFFMQSARADAVSAHKAYFGVLYAKGFDVASDMRSTVAKDTLVNGVYKVTSQDGGQFHAYISENGQIFGDAVNGWQYTGSNIALSGEEKFFLKVEVLHNIAVNKMIKVQYGDGGGRKMILLSSVDCPFCKKMEANLAQHADMLNTTFYVLPAALNGRDNTASALQQWDTTARIWCANDNAAAWKNYWARRLVPDAKQCGMDSIAARSLQRDFDEIMRSIWIRTTGSPAIIREDGKVFTPAPQFDVTQAESQYGKSALKEIGEVYTMSTIPLRFLGKPSSR